MKTCIVGLAKTVKVGKTNSYSETKLILIILNLYPSQEGSGSK